MTLKRKALIAVSTLLGIGVLVSLSGAILTVTGTYTEIFTLWQPSPFHTLILQWLLLAAIAATWLPLIQRLKRYWPGLGALAPYRWTLTRYGVGFSFAVFIMESLSWA